MSLRLIRCSVTRDLPQSVPLRRSAGTLSWSVGPLRSRQTALGNSSHEQIRLRSYAGGPWANLDMCRGSWRPSSSGCRSRKSPSSSRRSTPTEPWPIGPSLSSLRWLSPAVSSSVMSTGTQPAIGWRCTASIMPTPTRRAITLARRVWVPARRVRQRRSLRRVAPNTVTVCPLHARFPGDHSGQGSVQSRWSAFGLGVVNI